MSAAGALVCAQPNPGIKRTGGGLARKVVKRPAFWPRGVVSNSSPSGLCLFVGLCVGRHGEQIQSKPGGLVAVRFKPERVKTIGAQRGRGFFYKRVGPNDGGRVKQCGVRILAPRFAHRAGRENGNWFLCGGWAIPGEAGRQGVAGFDPGRCASDAPVTWAVGPTGEVPAARVWRRAWYDEDLQAPQAVGLLVGGCPTRMKREGLARGHEREVLSNKGFCRFGPMGVKFRGQAIPPGAV